MKIKVITSYKPGTWKQFAERAVKSVLENWPKDTEVCVYHETQRHDIITADRLSWVDIHAVQPELVKFKERHKNDPVANGELQQVPGGVR